MGLYAEDLEKFSLPPLVGRLIGIDAFLRFLTNPLLAENVFNPETFLVGWEDSEYKTLSDLLHRNIPKTVKKYKAFTADETSLMT